MSEQEHTSTATLLPNSGVAIFSRDPDTLDAARALEQDWRFARVEMAVQEGDTDTAIEVYKEKESPDLLIIQTDNIDESFTEGLDGLAANCDEDTAAIIIGPDNDVNLYRRLIEMGVSDYLVKPVATEDLAEIVVKTLIERLGQSGSKLLAVLGAKGGVGASTFAQGYAWEIANNLKQKVLLCDFSGAWSSLPVGVGYEPASTLSEAVRAAENNDEDSLKRVLHDISDKLSVLSVGSEAMLDEIVDHHQVEKLLNKLMVKYPVVVADLSGCPPKYKRIILSKAHHASLVSLATVSSLRLARTLYQEIKELRGGSSEDLSFITNMIGFAPDNELPKSDIKSALEIEPDGLVPYLPKLFVGSESEDAGLLENSQISKIMDELLLPIASKLLGVQSDEKSVSDTDNAKGSGIFDGFLGKIGTKK